MLYCMSTTYPSDLTDAEWESAQHYLPPEPRRGRPRTHPLRRVLDAIFSVLRTGCQWRYLPIDFSPWQTVFYHFRQFRIKNTLHGLYTALHRTERAGRHPDPSAAVMDSQSVKTVEESGTIRGFDSGKLVKGRKRHLLVDTLGLPIAWYVTPADMSDPLRTLKALADSWAVSRTSCRGSRRSGQTLPIAAQGWPTGANSRAAVGTLRSSNGRLARAASAFNRVDGWLNGVLPGWFAIGGWRRTMNARSSRVRHSSSWPESISCSAALRETAPISDTQTMDGRAGGDHRITTPPLQRHCAMTQCRWS